MPSLVTVCNPVSNPEEFKKVANTAAMICNCHSHTETCHKGKIGKLCCRCRRPHPLVTKTGCLNTN